MAKADDANTQCRVLHAVRVKGFATPQAIERTVGTPIAEVEQVLHELSDRGLVTHREGRVSGWRATPAGVAEHREMLVLSRDRPGMDDLRTLHDTFVGLNQSIKELCTAWQLRDGAPNDHQDADHDRSVITAIDAVHDQILSALDASTSFERRGWYVPRLTEARDRLVAGDLTALTKPLSESYHDVWMELHQDLIFTLDLVRTEADA
jgi:hypothetical protein